MIDHMDHLPDSTSHHPYRRLALMAVLSFAAMYILMYAMVDVFANVLPNINQWYMAGLMTMPMIAIELLVMGMMYRKKAWNLTILGVSLLVFLGCWFGIRNQFGVGDRQFLKSMIPHHASAILMCSQADLGDRDVKILCEDILTSQQAQIDWMKQKLR